MDAVQRPGAFSRSGVRFKREWLVWALVLSLLGLGAISTESFWIDEFSTAHFASQASLKAEWQEILRLRWPELQAPFYMAYIWTWAKVFGIGEWSLRFAGIPWFIAGALIFVMAWRKPQQRLFVCLAVVLNPFIWYYLNEARLYSMQLGCALATVGCLVRLMSNDGESDSPWVLGFCVSSLLLAAVNVLGMIWLGAALLSLPVLFTKPVLLNWLRKYTALAVCTALGFCLCGLYYLWAQAQHVAPTAGKTTWQTLCFVVYEQLGFNGLGPGRLALREGGMAQLKRWVPWLALYGLSLACVLAAAVRELFRQSSKRFLLIGLFLSLPGLFLVVMALHSNFRLLGRHFAPLAAVIALVIGVGGLSLWSAKAVWSKLVLLLFCLLTTWSCLAERFSERHAKDDYRAAAAIAKRCLQQHKQVWWNADSFGAEYYRVPLAERSSAPNQARLVVWPPLGFEGNAPPPDVVIASTKQDVYDPKGAVREYLSRNGYLAVQKLPAFVIFRTSGRGPDGITDKGRQ